MFQTTKKTRRSRKVLPQLRRAPRAPSWERPVPLFLCVLRSYGSLFMMDLLSLLAAHQHLNLPFNILELFKRLIHRSEADIRNLVEPPQMLHHDLTQLGTRDFPCPFLLHVAFNPVHELLKSRFGVGALFKRPFKPAQNLLAFVRHPPAVALHHRETEHLHFLDCGKAVVALLALPTPPNAHAFIMQTGIHYLGFFVMANGTMHRFPL